VTTNPVYPKSLLPWSDRVDEVDIVWAQDPNSIAADLVSVESTLGVMPQQMKNPILGNAINFVNVDQRLDYLTAGQNIPVTQLYNTSGFQVSPWCGPGTHYGAFNSYKVAYDSFASTGQPMYNGSDLTMPVTGWCVIDSSQFWEWHGTGYSGMGLYVGNRLVDYDKWDWGFPGNYPGGLWRPEVFRPACTHVHYEGIVNQGDRIRVVSENGMSSQLPKFAYQMSLSATVLRTTPRNNAQPPFNPSPPPPGPIMCTRFPPPPGMLCRHLGGGILHIEWDMFQEPSWPFPDSYNVAVYRPGLVSPLAYFTVVPAPAVFGRMEWDTEALPLGATYQVVVSANGALIPSDSAQIILNI